MTDHTPTEGSASPDVGGKFSPSTLLGLIVPILLLGGAIVLVLNVTTGLFSTGTSSGESLYLEQLIVTDGAIELVVHNDGPAELTIAQVTIADAVWAVLVTPEPTIPRWGQAIIRFDYEWVAGEPYEITVYTRNNNAITFNIVTQGLAPSAPDALLVPLTWLGLTIGLLPVLLGVVWLLGLRKPSLTQILFLLAFSGGALTLIGFKALLATIGAASSLPNSVQGPLVIVLSALGAALLLYTLLNRQAFSNQDQEGESNQALRLAYLVAVGVGLYGLGQGVYLGRAYALDQAVLQQGRLLALMIQHIVLGLVIIAPILVSRPTSRQLALIGLLGGFPALLGSWLSAYLPAQTWVVFTLSIGLGALAAIIVIIIQLLQGEIGDEPPPYAVVTGLILGLLFVWGSGFLLG